MAVAKAAVKAKKPAPLPEWKTPEAEALMKRRTNAFLLKHGSTEVLADLQALLTLSTKLTGYRRPCQMITAFKPIEAVEDEAEEPEEPEEEAEAEEEEEEE